DCERPAHGDCTGPPFFERRIIEERVRAGVKKLVGKGRRLSTIQTNRLDFLCLQTPKHAKKTVDVRCFMKTVVYCLPYQRMIGKRDVADDVFLAGRLRWKHSG